MVQITQRTEFHHKNHVVFLEEETSELKQVLIPEGSCANLNFMLDSLTDVVCLDLNQADELESKECFRFKMFRKKYLPISSLPEMS